MISTAFSIFKAAKSHDSSLYEYENFPCKDKNFTLSAPAILYHYNFTGNSAHANYAYRFTYHVNDGKKEDHSVVSTYPIGSKFKFIKMYSYSSFSGGTMSDFLIEDEHGLQSLVSNLEINTKECTINTIAPSVDNYYPSGSRNKMKDRNHLFDKEAKVYDFARDRIYLHNLSEQLSKTRTKSTLKLKIPNKEYLYFSRKILEKYMSVINENNLSVKVEFESEDITVPTFILNNKTFSQYTCENIDIFDIYSCYNEFPNWLNRPFQQDPYIKFSSPNDIQKQLSVLQKDDYIIIAYLPKADMRYYHFMVDDYLKAIYSYKKIKTFNNIKRSKNFFLVMGQKGKLQLSRGLNILNNKGEQEKNIFFLDYALDMKLNDFTLWNKYSSAFFDYHGMKKEISIYTDKKILTLFTRKSGLSYAKDIVKKIQLFKDNFVTIHVLDNKKSIFLNTLSKFDIPTIKKFKNLLVIFTRDKKKIAEMNINVNQINDIKTFIKKQLETE